MTDPDVIFVSYDEPNADENFARLRTIAPHAQRLHGVKGIYNAYQAAADLSKTPLFFMIDGDNWVRATLKLITPPLEADIYSWPSLNAVNGLKGRTGGLKLLRRAAVRTMDPNAVDFFASMHGRRLVGGRITTVNRFNATPFLAWRGAFRECVKLAGATVPDPLNGLHIWQTVGADKPNGLWCLIGARMGAEFGAANPDAVARINDPAYLAETFSSLNQCAGSLEISEVKQQPAASAQ